MVGMPETAPKTAGVPSGLPTQTITKPRAHPRSAAADRSLSSQTGGLHDTAASAAAAATVRPATSRTSRPGTPSTSAAAVAPSAMAVVDDDSCGSGAMRSRPVTSPGLHHHRRRHEYDDGTGDAASFIARFEMAAPKRSTVAGLDELPDPCTPDSDLWSDRTRTSRPGHPSLFQAVALTFQRTPPRCTPTPRDSWIARLWGHLVPQPQTLSARLRVLGTSSPSPVTGNTARTTTLRSWGGTTPPSAMRRKGTRGPARCMS